VQGAREGPIVTATLTETDLDSRLAVTRRYDDDGGEALPWELLHDLRELSRCDHLAASGQDSSTMTTFAELVMVLGRA
jgi:hypothetical protein